jgi:transketolase
MRAVFAAKLEQLMAADERVVLVDGDLGRANGTIGIKQRFPDRAFNVGVAEQNMASVAAGLASYGFIPFINSFAAFASRRICDQITISIAYAQQNVKIVGTDPGIAAELNGCTHMSVEDIGVLRSIPRMVIVEPADAVQTAEALPAIAAYEGPVYVRLFRKVAPAVFGEGYRFSLFKADLLREGRDITLLATGFMLHAALQAAEILAGRGVSAEVINPHTLKPLDAEAILASVRKTGAAVTCENHNLIGGLRSAVAEVISEAFPVPLKAVGVQDRFGQVSKLPFLLKKFILMPEDIVDQAMACLELKERLRS